MTWEPFTAPHAIERVRIVIHFAQPIQPKQVSSFASLVEKRRGELELGPQTRTKTNVVEIDASTGEARITKQPSGWSFSKTTSEGAAVEAVVLNPQFLLYEAASYEGWATFWPRYNAVTCRAPIARSVRHQCPRGGSRIYRSIQVRGRPRAAEPGFWFAKGSWGLFQNPSVQVARLGMSIEDGSRATSRTASS